MTPELLLSRAGELRDIRDEFSEYEGKMLSSPVQISIFQSLSTSLFLNLLFEPDPYSNGASIAKLGFDAAENRPFKVWDRTVGVQVLRRLRPVTPREFVAAKDTNE